MKIVVITRKTPQLSGGPRRLEELIKGMHRRNWKVVKLNVNRANLLNVAPRFFTRFLEMAILFLRLMKVHKKFCPEAVVFFTSLDGFPMVFYRVFHKNVQIIYCERADPVKGTQLLPIKNRLDYLFRPVEISFIRFVEKTICLKSDKVIFNSKARYTEVNNHVGKKISRAQVIPNNANPSWVLKWLSEFSENKTELSEITSSFKGKKVVGFVGNLYEIGNGLDILLSAFKLVSERVPEALLVIVGDGPDKEKLRQKVADLNLDNKVFFTGWAQNPLFYMMNLNVLVQPSRHHSCPNAILESLMCSIPVIGSYVGGIPEILKHDEFLFKPENTGELADKIIAILTGKLDPLYVKSLVTQLRRNYIFNWQEAMTIAIEDSLTKNFNYSISAVNIKKHESRDKSERLNVSTQCSQFIIFAQVIILVSFASYNYNSVHPFIAGLSILCGWLSIMVIPGYLFLNLLLREPMPFYEKFLYSVPLSILISSLVSITLFVNATLYLAVPLLFVVSQGMIALLVIRIYFTN